MRFEYDDGGRKAAGYRGLTRDCVIRAIAIAARLPYQQIYDALNNLGRRDGGRLGYGGRLGWSNARAGIAKCDSRRYLQYLGWQWHPTMQIGSGCTVHLRDGELPMGRLIVSLSRHMVAVIDGVIHDTHDPSRSGTRCVYGYWMKP